MEWPTSIDFLMNLFAKLFGTLTHWLQTLWGRDFFTNLIANLLGALFGILLAFRLENRRQWRQAKEVYARQLNACRYDLGQQHAVCNTIQKTAVAGSISIVEVDAPALRTLLASPALHEHAGHGFTVALTLLAGLIATARKLMDYHRLESARGNMLNEAAAGDMRSRFSPLSRLVEYILHLIDAELQRLGYGVVAQPEDRTVLDKINAVLAGHEYKE